MRYSKIGVGQRLAAAKILIVDDEPNVCELCSLYLNREQYQTKSIHHGNAALEAVNQFQPDLLILDLMLPGLDGWAICRQIRSHQSLPIIMLTARDSDTDRIKGLEIGADDYLVKPFNPRELVARVRAVLRRTKSLPTSKPGSQVLFHGELTLNADTHQVFVRGQQLNLSPKEFALLHCLLRRPGKTFTRTELLDQIWGYDYFGDERTVDVHVKRLRRKLTTVKAAGYVSTVWGVGYRLGETTVDS